MKKDFKPSHLSAIKDTEAAAHSDSSDYYDNAIPSRTADELESASGASDNDEQIPTSHRPSSPITEPSKAPSSKSVAYQEANQEQSEVTFDLNLSEHHVVERRPSSGRQGDRSMHSNSAPVIDDSSVARSLSDSGSKSLELEADDIMDSLHIPTRVLRRSTSQPAHKAKSYTTSGSSAASSVSGGSRLSIEEEVAVSNENAAVLPKSAACDITSSSSSEKKGITRNM